MLLLCAALMCGCQQAEVLDRVVLYCSQDKEYADELLAEFTRKTGIQVEQRADTEANKSVSLYEAIVREAKQPRCDVFWCNEHILMHRLAQRGLLESYESPSAAPYPSWTKGANHTYQGFAARARILIVHERVKDADVPESLEELAGSTWKKKWGIAKPFFGTTATHMACLWVAHGGKATRIFSKIADNAVILPGNRDVAQAVADGELDIGVTDTDDAIQMIEKKKPVRIVYPDQKGVGTLYLPNTVGIIKKCPHPTAARKLVDYLLSEEVERKLASGPSAQIPLNPEVKLDKPRIQPPASVKTMDVDTEGVARSWELTQSLLRSMIKD
jgi:iron(III) transport system substrate-binding protein